jgi:hypothetical protein
MATASSQSYDALIRSLEVAIEQAFANLSSAFSSRPSSLALERGRLLHLLDELSTLLRTQGDALLTLPDSSDDDACKAVIADYRRQIKQITTDNAKVDSVSLLAELNFVAGCCQSTE